MGFEKVIENIQNIYTQDKPRIIIGTIHSVKGGEADHVWVDAELTRSICREIAMDIGHAYDDEARLAYVAATRAKKTLGILRTRSRFKNPFFS